MMVLLGRFQEPIYAAMRIIVGLLLVLFCFIFLLIATRGAGMLSLDSVLFARPARIRVAGT
jgi:uncharacterized membrane protein YphA (DoxX/SURF4 family)